ncbi:MAG: DUF1905 domain-containing protein [Pedobacter sp.]|nr:MAG: DUF1905 domain-containing protein [Pedobacter sp.]
MITHYAEIERFETNGEKTGWTYVFIPQTIAEQIKPGERRSIRLRGTIDAVEINGVSLAPMGHGDFIMPLNKLLRKALKKEVGAQVVLNVEFDVDFKIEMPEDLELCLSDEDELLQRFLALTKSHQNYFINWLNTAKTEKTRTKRLVMIVDAMYKNLDFGAMLRTSRL